MYLCIFFFQFNEVKKNITFQIYAQCHGLFYTEIIIKSYRFWAIVQVLVLVPNPTFWIIFDHNFIAKQELPRVVSGSSSSRTDSFTTSWRILHQFAGIMGSSDVVARVKSDQARFKGMRPCGAVKTSSCIKVLESNPIILSSTFATEIAEFKGNC